MLLHVEFTDATKTAISSVFACPQDPADHPHLGEVEEDDPCYIKFAEALIQPAN